VNTIKKSQEQILEEDEYLEPGEPLELSVSFTPRVFPTPKRESNIVTENKVQHNNFL
jgi:hypothetical protein